MRLFIWPLILTIVLVLGFGEIAAPILERRTPHHRLPVHKTLYVERTVYNEQIYHLIKATMEWNEVTNGQVTFDIKIMPQRNINPSEAIIILSVNPDYPEIMLLDNLNQWSTLGYTGDAGGLSYILLVDERIDDKIYDTVIMHELGHALGMEHITGIEGWGTLMYPTTDLEAQHITNRDLYYFCKIYHCDSRKFHGIPQVQ